MNLLTHIRSLFEPAVAAIAPDQGALPKLLDAIKPANDPAVADYQANFAMSLSKALGIPAREVAERIVRFLGHTVITDNHLGDWGTQFGMLIYGYRNFLDKAAYERDPVRELVRVYKEVRRRDKEAGGDEEDETAANPIATAYREETA